MRRLLLGLLTGLGLFGVGTEAMAQAPFSNVSDPFFLYYGFYLPRQAAQSMQSGPEATINALTAARQSYASTNRSDMFDPSANSFNRFDMESDFLSGPGTRGRSPASMTLQAARHGGNLNGRGVTIGRAAAFNRTGNYHPALRSGQSRNANMAVVKGKSNFSGGGGMGAATPNVNVGAPGVR